MSGIRRTAAARFWEKVDKTETCWNWIGYVGTNGYGQFGLHGKVTQAHRWSYEQAKGPIPDGLVMDHLCRNRACVNPNHLEAVPQQLNALRGQIAEGRDQTCRNGHPRIPENVTIRKNGDRDCSECKRQRDRRRYYAQREAS